MPALPILLSCLLLCLLTGCAVNPATGERNFVMMSERQELDLGSRYNQQIQKEFPRYADDRLQAYVQRVGERVARHSHRANLNYIFTVVDSPDINAFALPGGYIYIHRGLMAYLNSEAELAAVLAHEVGHVTARHSVQQQSQSQAWNILGQAVAIGTGVSAAGDLTNVLGGAMVRGYGRDMELQADGLGAQYLARSGYDPQAMIEVVKVLKNQEAFARDEAKRKGQEVPEAGSYHGVFDTHPDNDTRLQQVVGPARALAGGQQEVNREAYLKAIDGMPFGDSADTGIRRGQQFFHVGLDFTLRYPDGWELVNRPEVLIGHPRDEQAFIAMQLAERTPGLTPSELLHQRAGRQRLVMEETFSQDGIIGVTAVVPGDSARRVAVVFKGDQAYLFIAGMKGRASLETEDARFLSVIHSFRALKPEERALAQPPRLHLVQVRAAETVAGIVRASGATGDQADLENRIRLINNLYPIGEPRAGDWLKVVR
ncbi:M48 family metalloprotease [Pseudomonas tohonis]|uniref:M48 family metalloprotease n=1 Tax=Pseudomonas tohonis TaxID=2725477 RepID=UPI0021DB5A8B|nr:M48 family metalloprotease [Pseudomonas tohonis]UXY52601.1 M48 family metalloprotease [Pseudomonas tohonis]